MSYQFTSAQIDALISIVDDIQAGTKQWFDGYHAVLGFISEVDPQTGAFVSPKDGVDGAVWQFIAAGDLINAGAQAQSQVTRDYTASQMLIRGTLQAGQDLDMQIQLASDQIAEAVISRIITEQALPTIDVIAVDDASQAAAFLFEGDLGGWAGNPLFVAFGHEESWQNNVLAEGRGTYDILAAIVSGLDAFGNMSIENLGSAISDFWETASGSDVGLQDIWGAWISDTNDALDDAYGGLLSVVDLGLGELFGPSNIFLGTIHDDAAITGSTGLDVIHGGAGNDRIVGRTQETGAAGGDIIDGGEGSDVVDYSGVGQGLIVILRNDANTSAVTETGDVVVNPHPVLSQIDHLFNIEKITGSQFVDKLYLVGDSMTAFSSIELIDLGDSIGGDGDIVNLSDFQAGAGIDLTGTQESELAADALSVINAEIVIGSEFDDTIIGSAGAETLSGGGGGDKFIVGGNDVILDPDDDDRIGVFGAGSAEIWLHGGVSSGGIAEDTGDGREEYERSGGEYIEETDAGTVTYYWTEGSSNLVIELPAGSKISVEDWENGKAGITLEEAPDDDKYDDSGELTSPLVLDLDGDGIELTDPWRS